MVVVLEQGEYAEGLAMGQISLQYRAEGAGCLFVMRVLGCLVKGRCSELMFGARDGDAVAVGCSCGVAGVFVGLVEGRRLHGGCRRQKLLTCRGCVSRAVRVCSRSHSGHGGMVVMELVMGVR